MRKEIGRYRCIGSDGREYTIIECQNYRRQPGGLTTPPRDYPTTREWFMPDGSHVNYIDENTFQIVLTDEVVKKIT